MHIKHFHPYTYGYDVPYIAWNEMPVFYIEVYGIRIQQQQFKIFSLKHRNLLEFRWVFLLLFFSKYNANCNIIIIIMAAIASVLSISRKCSCKSFGIYGCLKFFFMIINIDKYRIYRYKMVLCLYLYYKSVDCRVCYSAFNNGHYVDLWMMRHEMRWKDEDERKKKNTREWNKWR